MSRLLVHRFSSLDTGTEKGYVVPIAKENDDGTIEPTLREDFPNDNRVWISKEFGLIENNYAPTEIFYLNSYHESSEGADSTLGSTNANICKYFSLMLVTMFMDHFMLGKKVIFKTILFLRL